MDDVTAKWIRNKSDEYAVANGCWFDEERANHVISFFHDYLRLYEGEQSGQPFTLLDWQRDVLSRIFGWVRYSEKYNRPVRRFKKARIFVAKKNGKSPLGSGVGLYLLCADGEMGQKVFSAARDGKQASIIHTHARRMVELSPQLRQSFRINKSTGRISFEETMSFYDLLAGDNIEGQEGLNGSVIIDELHVVDNRLAAVLEYMGASRAEPLDFGISTAGKNPEGYGRKEWEYGRRVESGQEKDDAFFFASWHAPQDATEEVLADPETWRAANPSMGHTIDEKEFEAAFKKSRRTETDRRNFNMYRLNIWQNTGDACPLLKENSWQKCKRDYTLEDLKGRVCYLGMDASLVSDTTALILLFPWESEDDSVESRCFRIWPYLFLPKKSADKTAAMVRWYDWAAKGHINLTEGDSTDFPLIRETILEIQRQFILKGLVYDPKFAEYFCQRLKDEDYIDVFPFVANMNTYTQPTQTFQRMVGNQSLQHPGNECLDWQAGNCAAREKDKLVMPVKPEEGKHYKIDGIVATILALGYAMQFNDDISVYDSPGAMTL